MSRNNEYENLRDSLLKREKELEEKSKGYMSSEGCSADSGDEASRIASFEVNSQLAAHEAAELLEVQKALSSIEAGTYGICEGCKKQIALERLKALPYTNMCVNCKAEQETQGPNGGRGNRWGDHRMMITTENEITDKIIRTY